jgi:hypothetical protein
VAPGPYRLQVDAHAEQDGNFSLSDAVSIPVTVVSPDPSPGAR